MSKFLKSYATFTRTEQIGLVCLCGLLIVLITIRATMHLWAHPTHDTEKEQKLVASWQAYTHSQPPVESDSTPGDTRDYVDASDNGETPLPEIININTADSATLVRLKGIGPVSAGKIIMYRKMNGPFTDVNQLKEVCRMHSTIFEILKPHLSVN